ncbi:MAG: arginase family protein [Chloroflexi bacterium]|nr:arginase family protein [Chloroflexota bacterium]
MSDQIIITPYFLDSPVPELTALAKGDALIHRFDTLAGQNQQQRMSVLHKALAQTVAKSVQAGRRPVSIAGDCCTTIGVLAGLQWAGLSPTLIWFDAHGDFNTWETTPSGFLGGMPLAMLVGRGEQTMPRAVKLAPQPEDRVIITDARDLDPGEREALAASRVHHLSDVIDLLQIDLPAGPLYVHFDTDVLDPTAAPAQNYPASGGPTAEELSAVFRRLAQTSRVAAISMSTWNPALDADGRTRTVCMNLLRSLF